MRGTGRYNLAQGAVATTQGVGAAVSALIAGEVTDHFGYSVSFWFLGAVAALACLVFFAFMPETRGEAERARGGPSGRALMTLANLASTNFSATSLAALVILALTYAGIALGRIPGLRLDRAGIALPRRRGDDRARPLSLDDAFRAIDFNTIALLLGMMIVVAHLKVSGAFRALGALAIEHAHRPLALLVTVTLLAGVLSAFLVNDAICLVMAPMVLTVTRALGRNPLPYLIATATASNCGSVATITGNPQNMVIGAYSGISYPAFAASLAPVAAFGLVAAVVVVRAGLPQGVRVQGRPRAASRSRSDAWRSGGQGEPRLRRARVAFFAGVEPAKAAVLGGAFLLVTRSHQARPDLPRDRRAAADDVRRPLRRGRRRRAGAAHARPDRDGEERRPRHPLAPVGLHRGVSNIVSNVPAVLALKPFVPTFGDPRKAWLIVAMSSTLAGNFTLLGSVANLIVAEQARAEGAPISFWAYFKVGLPLTLVTLAAGTWWLAGR